LNRNKKIKKKIFMHKEVCMSSRQGNYDNNFESYVLGELEIGRGHPDVYREAVQLGYAGEYKTFVDYCRNLKKRRVVGNNDKKSVSSPEESLLNILKKNGGVKIMDLCSMYDCSPRIILQTIENLKLSGYEITNDGFHAYLGISPIFKTKKIDTPLAEKEIVFGVASDLHFGSNACQITALNEFCHICKKEGVKNMFVPGDAVAGVKVYTGQINDQYAKTAPEQIETIVENLPSGFDKWYVLGGNHDYSFIKHLGGYNVLRVVESRRSDIEFLDYDSAEVPILENVDVKMIHPKGGNPYSFSYRMQKHVEGTSFTELSKVAMGSKDKPTIRFVLLGHLHIQVQAMFGPIFGAQCGCFEGETNLLKQMGVTPTIGGYIIKATADGNGMLKNFEAKFYMFPEVKDDWKNYIHPTPSDSLTNKKYISPILEIYN